MKAVIMQPTYLPWMGYFDLIDQSDVFVILDDVQFEKQSWQSRNKIKTPQGEHWLSIPVVRRFPQLLKDVQINNSADWARNHFKTICQNYQKSAKYALYVADFEKIYSTNWARLIDLNVGLIRLISNKLGIEKKMVFSSSLNVTGSKVSRLIDICKKLRADNYLSPAGKSRPFSIRSCRQIL